MLPVNLSNSYPDEFGPTDLKIKWAFFIVGFVSFFFFVLFFVTYLYKRQNQVHPSREVKEIDEENLVGNDEKRMKFRHKLAIVTFAALFSHLTYGIELLYGKSHRIIKRD